VIKKQKLPVVVREVTVIKKRKLPVVVTVCNVAAEEWRLHQAEEPIRQYRRSGAAK